MKAIRAEAFSFGLLGGFVAVLITGLVLAVEDWLAAERSRAHA